MTRALVVAIVACLALAFGVASVLALSDTSEPAEEHEKDIADGTVEVGEDEGRAANAPKFLEDPENYPPGITKHLEKHGTLPPGLQKKLEEGPPENGLREGTWLPPGLARKDTLPPGLAKQDEIPPGWMKDSDGG
jgi:hypothetical protein